MKKASSISSRIKSRLVESTALPTNVLKVSYSQYSVYRSCPYRWYLSYAKKVPYFNSSIDTVFGTALHETLQKYLELLYNEGLKDAESLDVQEFLLEALQKAYATEKDKNEGKHFTTKLDMESYYSDGLHIMHWIKKNRKKLFDTKNIELVGIEIPVLHPISEDSQKIWFNGFIDIVFYDKLNNRYLVIDVKTSREGWKDYAKKDETKISQILLYKIFFSKQFDIPEDDVDVEFMICKRKVWEESPYPIPRVQKFIPANGSIKVNKALGDFGNFIQECYTATGEVVEKPYLKNPGKNMSNCRFCPFNSSDLCDKKNP